jgi:hypothetical protein
MLSVMESTPATTTVSAWSSASRSAPRPSAYSDAEQALAKV